MTIGTLVTGIIVLWLALRLLGAGIRAYARHVVGKRLKKPETDMGCWPSSTRKPGDLPVVRGPRVPEFRTFTPPNVREVVPSRVFMQTSPSDLEMATIRSLMAADPDYVPLTREQMANPDSPDLLVTRRKRPNRRRKAQRIRAEKRSRTWFRHILEQDD